MISTLAVANYRSLLNLRVPLGRLNLVTGANGSGKSNLYRALRLLALSAEGGVIPALAKEGGIGSTLWAGPERFTRSVLRGETEPSGQRSKPIRLRLGFGAEDFGYSISLGLPRPNTGSMFDLDPEIKRECLWAGPFYRAASLLVDRRGSVVRVREKRKWVTFRENLPLSDSIFTEVAAPEVAPEVLLLRERVRSWRFYDQLRSDGEALARHPQLGTRTPVLHHDGRDLAAALQTIRENGDDLELQAAIEDAFPGSGLEISVQEGTRFLVKLRQPGMLRPLLASELSDGTLRYLLLAAALLTPRLPPLLVLNEPESSLHPELYPALARLIQQASERTQIWVVSHAPELVGHLARQPNCCHHELGKEMGATRIAGQLLEHQPQWPWPEDGG